MRYCIKKCSILLIITFFSARIFAEKFILIDDSVIRAKIIKTEDNSYIILNKLGLFRVFNDQIASIEQLPDDFNYEIDENKDYFQFGITEINIKKNNPKTLSFNPFTLLNYYRPIGEISGYIQNAYGLSLCLNLNFPNHAFLNIFELHIEVPYIHGTNEFNSSTSIIAIASGPEFTIYRNKNKSFRISAAVICGPALIFIKNEQVNASGYSLISSAYSSYSFTIRRITLYSRIKYDFIYDKTINFHSVGCSIGAGYAF